MRFSLDANVLFYSLESAAQKTVVAENVLFGALSCDCFLTNQVLGEVLNAVRRKLPDRVEEAQQMVASWSAVFPTAPTSTQQLIEASALAERHKLQFWDSVILVVAADAGAEYLLTEDMQDGATIRGVTLLDPFRPDNQDLIETLLTPAP